MEGFGCVSSTTGWCCSLPQVIKKNCKHFRTPRTNIEQLKNLMHQLEACKRDVELRPQQGAEERQACNIWLDRVDKVEREVSSLMDENGPHRPTEGCNVICSRIKFGKLIEKKIRDIQELLQSVPCGEESNAIAMNERGDVLSATPVEKRGPHGQIFEEILEFLHDENTKRIGVWGMGGAGKTTIMSKIYDLLVRGNSQFNCIWVEASKDQKKVQQDIAKKLGLTFQETDDGRARATKLLQAFNRRKKYVLILDDVLEPFSIEEVGIPVPAARNGCKLVIITPSPEVCREMGIDKEVEVKVLDEEEAMNLFKDKVRELERSDPRVQSIAMEVAKECEGLPLAIVTVGGALRNTIDKREWENVLKELRRISSSNGCNFDEVVHSRLKLSYSKLKDDAMRRCFLFCALYPKGHIMNADELINYWAWEELLGAVSMPAMKRKGEIIIDELISSWLLESKIENGARCVKMHDLIRDMAVKIISTDPRCIVNAGIGQDRPPALDEWKDVQWVSLMRNDLKAIDLSPMCPRLTSLLLQHNSFENKILDNFFDNMPGLKVLDLSYTWISCLPMSLSNLKNLCALILSHCRNLVEVPSLARLTQLKYIDFSFSRKLTRLPEGMEQLTKLRHLDFSFTLVQDLKDGVLSNFTFLEELLIIGSPMIGALSEDTKYPVRVEEIVSCHKLSLVHVQLHGIAAYQNLVKCPTFSQLKEFKLVVGYELESIPELFEKTILAIDMYGAEKLSEEEITEFIPRNVMQLEIQNCLDMIKRLSLHLRGAMCLKTCTIRTCLGMECILESEENNLSLLERMNLYKIVKFEDDLREGCETKNSNELEECSCGKL